MGATERLRAREQRARLARLLRERAAQDEELSLLQSEVSVDPEAWADAQAAIASGAARRLVAWLDHRVQMAVPAPPSGFLQRMRPTTVRSPR